MLHTRLMIAILLVAAAEAVGEAECFAYTATYEAATGNVRLEWTQPKELRGMIFSGPGVPVKPPEGFGGFFDLSIQNQVAWLFFSGISSPLDVDGVVPGGLSQARLEESYFSYITFRGDGGEPYFMTWEYLAVPEASSGLLWGVVSVVMMLAARRRIFQSSGGTQ
jgi:hypothetical protein